MDLYTLFSLFVLISVSATKECTNVYSKALECVIQQESPLLQGDVEKAKKACNDRSLHKAVDCLENLLESCKDDKVDGPRLRQYIDVDSTRRSVNYLCENLGAFEIHSTCIKEGHEDIVTCTRNGQKLINAEGKTGNQRHIDRVCRFTKLAFHCLETVLDNRCGPEANNFLYNVMAGQEPIICKYLDESGTTRTQSVCLTILTSLATVLLSFILR